MYARVCIELDVSKPFLDKLWMGTTKDYGWLNYVEYEGNHAYCTYCGLIGHMVGLCRKKRQIHGNAPMETNVKEQADHTTNRNNVKERTQWVAKAHEDIGKNSTEANNPRQLKIAILKKSEEGVIVNTRQALINAGLNRFRKN